MAAAHGQRTVDYSALERTCGSPKGDPRSDIFFLGCVFYQMLTGQLPMPEVESKDLLAKMLKRSFGAIKPLSEQRHAPDPELTRIIEKMMKIDLKARYQTMDEVIADLEAYLGRQGPGRARSEPPRRPGRCPRPSRVEPGGRGPPVSTPTRTSPSRGRRRARRSVPCAVKPEEFEVKAVKPKTLLCVEVQEEIQEAFRKTLGKMGYRVLLVADAERAAERYARNAARRGRLRRRRPRPRGARHFLDMHEKAHEDGPDLAALVLLGPRQQSLAKKLPTDDRLVVLPKPLKMKEIVDAVAQLAPAV